MSRSAGHCMTMGTASTMACMVEALGLGLPHNAAIPAVIHAAWRWPTPRPADRRMVRDDVRITRILTRHAFENAIRVNGAVEAQPTPSFTSWHSRRIGMKVTLDDWDHLGREVPTPWT